jgi:DNA-directed RNA polymerase specialized sigma24 family protein
VEEHSRTADFVELHGDRLFGFAMLVTLGDRVLAGKVSAEALAKGVERISELRHPVRAAAWLRGEVTKGAGRTAWGHQRPSELERREALEPLGVEPAAFDALASLGVRSRAAIVATSVEGFSPADVFEIVGSDDRVRRARRDYLTAYLASSETRQATPPSGELAARVRSTAAPVLRGIRE